MFGLRDWTIAAEVISAQEPEIEMMEKEQDREVGCGLGTHAASEQAAALIVVSEAQS